MIKQASKLRMLDSTLHQISEKAKSRSFNQQGWQANILSNALTRGNPNFPLTRNFHSEQKSETHHTLSRSLTPVGIRQEHSHNWTSLESEETQIEAYQKLRANVHRLSVLGKNGYRTEPYMRLADLEKHRKCMRCLRTLSAIYGELLS